MTTWWGAPLSTLLGPWLLYDIRGFVLPSYTLFGLMLGIATGTFIRRTAPAMALTFVILLVSSLALHNAYPYLVPPLSKIFALSDNQNARWGQPTDLTLYAGYADQAGHETGEISQYCGFNRTIADPDYGTLANKCISEHHLQWRIIYQPADRFWALQGVEAAILLLLAVAFVPLTYWQLRKRIN